jgi:uncharacterized protein
VPKGSDFRTTGLPVWIEAREDGVVLALHVQPGARRTAVVGLHGDRLKIAVGSPPTEGRANAALLEFLARRLRVAKSALELASGAGSREKRVAVRASLSASAIVAALLAQ